MAQPDSLKTRLNESIVDTMQTDTVKTDSVRAGAVKPTFQIPWVYQSSLDDKLATNDSLLRWQNWPNWTYKKNRDPGVFSFRLGTTGRTSAMLVDAHEPRHQQLFWEDVNMNDPVSGIINWNVIPHHKIGLLFEDNSGIRHESRFHLKQYYVIKPHSKLIFDESKFDKRALEFLITQNFSRKTNAEVSYWDRRDGGGYPNSQFRGRQIFGRVFHQLDNRQLLKLRFLNGKRTLGESFGYVIPDPGGFAFNRFSTVPVESGAESETGFTTLALSYHRRKEDTTAVPENLRAGLFFNNHTRELSYSADTTYYKVRSAGAFLHKWFDLNEVRFEGTVSYEQFFNGDLNRSNISRKSWNLLTTKGATVFEPVEWWNVKGEASYYYRDRFSSYTLGAGMEFNFRDRFKLSGGASRGTIIPTPQQLYWNSTEFLGNPDLEEERIDEVHGSAELQLFNVFTAGVKGQIKQIDNGIFVNADSSFVNAGEYTSLSTTGYLDYSGTHFEISASATMHRYQDYIPDPSKNIPEFRAERIWLKGSAYWKGYLFNRATYVKAGVSGIFAPQNYLADHYNSVLDYWQPAGNDQLIPWFSRLDVDLSARVRSIMFVMRYENVLDDVNQLGYFETANYPMPPRRFLFGVRVIFTN